MKHVSLKSIEAAIQKVDNLTDDGLERMSETYALAQQELLGYLMSAVLEYDNPKLEGLIIYYFCLICEAFAQEGIINRAVVDVDIEEMEKPFFELLDAYFDQNDEDMLDDFCDQPHLTQFMAMEVSVKDEDGTELDDETATQLFIVSLALITLMNRSQKDA
jgi:hypothetical protein